MTNAKVDVLIPVFNAEATLLEAVGSMQRQTVEDLRIILVNDGSTDSSPALMRDLAAADSRIVVLDQPNGGIVTALNTGIAECHAPLVARHDADDLAYPQRLAVQLQFMSENPDCVAVSCAVRPVDIHGHLIGDPVQLSSPDMADFDAVPTREPYLIHPFLLTRRSALAQAGGYRYVHHAEDTDLYWRLQEFGGLYNLPDMLGDHRIHTGSITGRSIINGRISATFSQLAALSARRRRSDSSDFCFERDELRHYVAAANLPAIIERAALMITRPERDRLEVTVAAKMLELAGYKPYELEIGDCHFIHSALRRHTSLIRASDRGLVDRMWAGTTARLLRKGLLREASALVAPRIWPAAITRLALRLGPREALRIARRYAGRAHFSK